MERSLIKFLKVFYTEVSSILTKISKFSGLTESWVRALGIIHFIVGQISCSRTEATGNRMACVWGGVHYWKSDLVTDC